MASNITPILDALEKAIYECLTRSESVKNADLHRIITSLCYRLHVKAKDLEPSEEAQKTISDEDLLDDE